MSDDDILNAAKRLDGSRRFYPPYKHPATQALRDHLDELLAFGFDEDHPAVQHDRRELARFEHGEDRAKRDYLTRARDNLTDTLSM